MSLSHKNLLLAVKSVIEKHPELKEVLEGVVKESEGYLGTTKTFEYTGPMEMKYGAAIKLKALKSDMDDVIRMLADKRTDIAMNIYMCLVVLPDDPKLKGEDNASNTSK